MRTSDPNAPATPGADCAAPSADVSAQRAWPQAAGLVGLCLLVVLSRLPWIAADYGTDPDSHRVVLAARQLASTGTYAVSRFPGYPVHECLTAAVIRWGPVAANGLSMLFSVLGALCVALLARRLGVRRYLLPAAAFALTPVVFIASVSTIDYVWATACILAGVYCAVRMRPVLAGVLIGLATGCRITSGAMVLPLAWYWFARRNKSARRFHGLAFLAAAGGVGFACYIPLLCRYGLRMLSFYEHGRPPLRDVFVTGTVGVWGTLGVLAFALPVAALAFCGAACRARLLGGPRRELAVFGMATALYLLAYLRLPHEAGYLMPVVPFVLLAIGLIMPPAAATVFFILLSLAPFFTIGRSGVHAGQILQDRNNRLGQARQTAALIAAAARTPAPAAIIAGEDLPAILTALGSDRQGPHRYVYLVGTRGEYDALCEAGRRVYVLPRAQLSNVANYGLDLVQCGAAPLDWGRLVRAGTLDAAAAPETR